MNLSRPLTLLGGLTAAQFMKRHWQRKPLLVRGAVPGLSSLVPTARLIELAGRDDVESRLIARQAGGRWQMKRGPFAPQDIPSPRSKRWTLLVQGMDLHDPAIHALMQQFRFVPEARLDDVMISHATDGGGVGPHFDSYDVFLLQAHGRRRWRIGRQRDLDLQPGVPLKILARFEPEEEFVLEPGDMLYLPTRWAHDGIAEGECQLERQRRLKPWIAGLLKAGKRAVRVKYGVDEDVCTGDHACIRLSGCPTLTLKDNPDPLKVDPVATVIDGCVGCGLCGENAHAATLCPSFYRAEVVQNPRWHERLIDNMRRRVTRAMQPA